jgi:glycosyltransferase involved in cell wall biosynthesis
MSFCEAVTDKDSIVLVTGGPIAGEKNVGGVRVIVLPMAANRLGLLSWSFALRKFLKSFVRDNDVSVINFHIPPLIPGLFLPRVAKVVVTAHTTYLGMSGQFYKVRQFRSPWNPVSVWTKRLFERVIFSKSDAIIVLTEQGRQEVLSYGFQGPVKIVPNGAAIDVFTPGEAVTKDYDVLFAGRIERRKGSRPMVEVCKALIASDPTVRICIVGSGDDFDYVTKSLAPFQKNIELAGKISFEDIVVKYRRSKIYASTSYYEGLPGTCLEAMAVGLPAVVWNYPFYQGLVIDNVTGFTIAPNEVGIFTNTILSILANPAALHEMGVVAREKIYEGYSWKIVSDRIVKALGDVASAK